MIEAAYDGMNHGPVDGRQVGFARWRSELPSGGNRYDDRLTAGLRELGFDLREYPVTGAWPLPEEEDRRALTDLLTGERHWLIGNIVASAVPEAIAAAAQAGARVTVLMHYFPADDPAGSPAEREQLAASEARAVAAATAVVVPSAWAAEAVATRYGRGDAIIAVPGVEPAERATGSAPTGDPPMLLWLGRLTRTKDPLTFVEALIRIQDLDWSARLVGPDTVDEDLSRQLRSRISDAGLTARIAVPGSQRGDVIESTWAQTDLLVHTSKAETYGMVISEALAHGIPSIVPSGTGAVDAQQVGAMFKPGNVDELERLLRGWLSDRHLQERWRADAAGRRSQLPTWAATARIVASALAR